MTRPAYLSLWAKTCNAPEGVLFHPLPYHLLDVAAVAERLIAQDRLLMALADRQGIRIEALERFVLLLVALHDIGKANILFQLMQPGAITALSEAGFPVQPPACFPHSHGQVTAAYLEAPPGEGTVAGVIERLCPGLLGRRRRSIVDPIAGHHGRPVPAADFQGSAHTLNAPYEQAAGALAADLATLFECEELPDFLDTDRARRDDVSVFSWFLAAVLPVADWLGSNQSWFARHPPTLDLHAYWHSVARPNAEIAVAGSGLLLAGVSPPGAERTLAGFDTPSPLQSHVLTCPLPAGPSLFVIEDATGSGKTEAALTLAHRLMKQGYGNGFFFGLPTTATADAMFARLSVSFRQLFVEGEINPHQTASLALSHGRVRLMGDDASVGDRCAAWIADDRRKAFLAQAGAGTIDQALMAVLPVKYQSLRLHGLRNKIIILDEIHSFDPFMQREIETLLEMHALLGGSAIVMSATLPLKTRTALATAFRKGCHGRARREAVSLQSRAYPLVTAIAAREVVETPLGLGARSVRRVAVQRLGTVADAEAEVIRLARSGACVALVRSTVDAAIVSHARLCEALGADRIGLLHSRFLPEHRREHECAAIRHFGKGSDAGQRHGRVLVATQIIEQSLDLDFDALVTDLAPIDLLIQRAGRLQRHQRADRPPIAPVLRVISPEATDAAEADWLDKDLVEARWVYGNTALLWQSAQALFSAGAIETATLAEGDEAPAHVRRLVDAVYEGAPETLPSDSLRTVALAFWGKDLAGGSLARQQLLKPSDGYVWQTSEWGSEARISTRLEDSPRLFQDDSSAWTTKVSTRLEESPRVTIRLARREGGRLVPMSSTGGWPTSEIATSEKFADGTDKPTDMEKAALSPSWADEDEGIKLLVIEAGIGAGGYAYDPARGLLRTIPAAS